MAMTVKLHETLWRENADLAEACLEHPFVRGLADGSLPRDVFARYVAQDTFYLEAFFRAYAVAAARCVGRHDAATVFHRLMGGVLDELEMHARHADELGIDIDVVEPLPATAAYVDFLMNTAWNSGLGEIIGAMTPCMRLYAFLGQALADQNHGDHLYRSWIDSYSGDEMEELALRLEALLDEFATDVPEIRRLYRRVMELELDFFSAAFGGET